MWDQNSSFKTLTAAACWAPTEPPHSAEHLPNVVCSFPRQILKGAVILPVRADGGDKGPIIKLICRRSQRWGLAESELKVSARVPPQRHLFYWQPGICVQLAALASQTMQRLVMLLVIGGCPRLAWSQTDYWGLVSCPHPTGCPFTGSVPTRWLALHKLCLLQQSSSGAGISTPTKTAAANTYALLKYVLGSVLSIFHM